MIKKSAAIIFSVLLVLPVDYVNSTDKEKTGKKPASINFSQSDVFMQGFYWNSTPFGIWYDSLSTLAAQLASAGFGAVWIPPAAKGGGSMSMGYDIYDHYDFGQYNQKGTYETRFGSRSELENMINVFHSAGLQLFYDAVLNHAGNGDQIAPYQCGTTDSGYVIFNPQSGRFPKTAANFHPNNIHCDRNDPYHNSIFFEDLCQYSAGTGDSLIAWGEYITNQLGFDGFRIDAVKHIEPEWMAEFTMAFPGLYMVGEHWSGTSEIIDYYNQVVNAGGNISLFDFPLRYTIQDMCNNTTGTFDMNNLYSTGLINNGMNPFAVATFVENHDFDRIGWDGQIDPGHDPVISDKEMGYAYIIFSEGRPSVFFKDYFDYDLGGKIDTLIWIRQTFLYGSTTKGSGLNPWYVGNGTQQQLSEDLFVARRNGGSGKPQAFLLINDHPTEWRGVWVDSDYPNQWFRDYTGVAIDKQAASDGRVELFAPPRGYAIYVPDTTQTLNNPPVLQNVPDITAFTNSFLEFQLIASDVNDDSLTFTISGNPAWLNLSSTGLLFGTPAFSDTGSSEVNVQVTDDSGLTDSDTFFVHVLFNLPPVIQNVNDTTITATYRYEYQLQASDPDDDTLHFILTQHPSWLSADELSGLIAGTPAISDTGLCEIHLYVTDNKGAFDSLSFEMSVIPPSDSIIYGYGKPVIDGNVVTGETDWLEDWLVVSDPDSDSYWHPADTLDNEIIGLFITWDADSLYIGIDYIINDNFNTLMLYCNTGLAGGITDFNSQFGYIGEYPKNFRFRNENAVDLFAADYYLEQPSVFLASDQNSIDITEEINGVRGNNGEDAEIAVAWNSIYHLGPGLVPPNVKLDFIAVVAGGFNYGGGDSAPDNPDINGDEGPDSLIFLVSVLPDTNGNGIPDPTLIITHIEDNFINKIPDNYLLYQNFPNPFNPVTKIRYSIPGNADNKQVKVQIKIYDVLGREITTLVDTEKPAGNYETEFDARKLNLSSGIYLYSFSAGGYFQTKKMLLLK
ncbi:MAG: hypothetical protein Kow0098_02500 [Ignavibacteriaceae bacterium]